MGDFARRNSWVECKGTKHGLRHIKEITDTGGFFAVVPCDQDGDLGTIRHNALSKIGCETYYATCHDGTAQDVLVLLASQNQGDTFSEFIEQLTMFYGCHEIIYSIGKELMLLHDQARIPIGTWTDTLEQLDEIAERIFKKPGLHLVGVYDTSVRSRHARSLHPKV